MPHFRPQLLSSAIMNASNPDQRIPIKKASELFFR